MGGMSPSKKNLVFVDFFNMAPTFLPSIVVEKDRLGDVFTWLRTLTYIFYEFSENSIFASFLKRFESAGPPCVRRTLKNGAKIKFSENL